MCCLDEGWRNGGFFWREDISRNKVVGKVWDEFSVTKCEGGRLFLHGNM